MGVRSDSEVARACTDARVVSRCWIPCDAQLELEKKDSQLAENMNVMGDMAGCAPRCARADCSQTGYALDVEPSRDL